jgi:hypothetical protein
MSYEVIDSRKPSPNNQTANPKVTPKISEHDIIVSDSHLDNLQLEENKHESSTEEINIPKRTTPGNQRKPSRVPTHIVRKSENFWSSSNAQLWESLNLKSHSQAILVEPREKRSSQTIQEKTNLSNSLKATDHAKDKGWIAACDRVPLSQIKKTANLYKKNFIRSKKENKKVDKYSTMDMSHGLMHRSDGFSGGIRPSLDIPNTRILNSRESGRLSGLKDNRSRNSSSKINTEAMQHVKSMTNSVVKQKNYMSEKHQDYIGHIGSKMSRSIDKDVISRQRQKFA